METEIASLLLDCLHQDESRISAARLAALSPADWQLFLALAKEQKVDSLLYHRLTSRGWAEAVPAEVLSTLQAAYHANAVKNLRLQSELASVVAALHDGEIPVIALKGAHLALAVYDQPALRMMTDLDLLVPTRDLETAAAILEAQGYRPLQPYKVGVNFKTIYRHLPRFVKPQAIPIELHWNIASPVLAHCIDPAELWERAVPLHLADVDALGLSVEDLLLHLCYHTSYPHQFEFGLRPSCDIAELIRHHGEALAWPQVVQRTQRWQWERGVYLALRLAQELVGAAVPEKVLRELRPAALDESLVTTARMQIFTEKRLTSTISRNMTELWGSQGLKGKLRAFWHSLFLPKAILAKQYAVHPDSPKLYLYYPVRLKDMLARYWRVTLKLYRGDPALTPMAQRKTALQKWLAE